MDILSNTCACPSCGHDKFDPEKQCVCGYQADESFLVESFIMGSGMHSNDKNSPAEKEKTIKNIVKTKNGKPREELVFKEIDSWIISFSQDDNCVYFGTPALQSFKLKITLNDLEELLEFIYKRTGQKKTIRKLQLSERAVSEVINLLHGMIEDKKSRMAINFTDNELRNMANLITERLKI